MLEREEAPMVRVKAGLHPFILHLSRIPLAHDDSSPGNNDLTKASRYSYQLNDTRRHQDVRGHNSQQKRIHITYPKKHHKAYVYLLKNRQWRDTKLQMR